MLSMLIITVALGIAAPAQAPEAVDILPLDQAPVSVSDLRVQRLSPSLTGLDEILITAMRSRPITIRPGAEGVVVVQLQERLRALGVFRGEADGVYGRETAASVVAFHKLIDVERTDRWLATDWDVDPALDHQAILDRNPAEADRVEVDITRQLLFVIRDSDVAAIVAVSTGNGATYWSKNGGTNGGYVKATTPRGDFTLFRHVSGWRVTYLGGLYKPWYFTPYYAIHGSKRVPAQPASHGCVRVPTWESNHLDDFLTLGLPVHIWEA